MDITISIAPRRSRRGRVLERSFERLGCDTLVDCPLFNGPMGLDRLAIDPAAFDLVSAADGILPFRGLRAGEWSMRLAGRRQS